MNVHLPYQWEPRSYQRPLWRALESGATRALVVWHRRAGKDSLGLNWLATQAVQRPGLYWHMLPSYKQGRKIIWEGKTGEGKPFLSAFPTELVTRRRDDEMTLWLQSSGGESMFQVVGGDDVDTLVGCNPVGVVFSEFSLHNVECWNYIRPILAENGGWALFLFTPRGQNHAYRLMQLAQQSRIEQGGNWYTEMLTVEDTGVITQDSIEDDRRSGMPEEMIQQEYYCSFTAALVGSYYGDQMNRLDLEQRITAVPWDPAHKVETGWDIGVSDSTAIWFAQQVGREVRLINYLEGVGKGIEHYAKLLTELPYTYGDHHGPHDLAAREFISGAKSVEQVARELGVRFRVQPRISVADGIQSARALLPRCVFDSVKTADGIEALRAYRKDFDSDRQSYRNTPRHDWASHGADAFRSLAIGLRADLRIGEKMVQPSYAIA